MSYRSDDPIADFDRKDAEDYAYEQKCPVCDICGEHITDDYYYTIGGITFHLDCADRHSVENYVNGY